MRDGCLCGGASRGGRAAYEYRWDGRRLRIVVWLPRTVGIDPVLAAIRGAWPDPVRWWSERTTVAAFGRRIHPDGHGVWRDDAGETGFFLELNRGTESLIRLVDKLAAYRRLKGDGGPDYPVLFALPGPTREEHLRAKLVARPTGSITQATCVTTPGVSPAGAVWWVAGQPRSRIRLTRIPGEHGPLGPLTPGPATPDHHPLALLTGRSAGRSCL